MCGPCEEKTNQFYTFCFDCNEQWCSDCDPGVEFYPPIPIPGLGFSALPAQRHSSLVTDPLDEGARRETFTRLNIISKIYPSSQPPPGFAHRRRHRRRAFHRVHRRRRPGVPNSPGGAADTYAAHRAPSLRRAFLALAAADSSRSMAIVSASMTSSCSRLV